MLPRTRRKSWQDRGTALQKRAVHFHQHGAGVQIAPRIGRILYASHGNDGEAREDIMHKGHAPGRFFHRRPAFEGGNNAVVMAIDRVYRRSRYGNVISWRDSNLDEQRDRPPTSPSSGHELHANAVEQQFQSFLIGSLAATGAARPAQIQDQIIGSRGKRLRQCSAFPGGRAVQSRTQIAEIDTHPHGYTGIALPAPPPGKACRNRVCLLKGIDCTGFGETETQCRKAACQPGVVIETRCCSEGVAECDAAVFYRPVSEAIGILQ